MPVPDFQSFLLPMLRIAADGQEHTMADFMSRLIEPLKLSEEDQKDPLPSGRQSRFYNRTVWASEYFVKACVFQRTRRGVLQVTDRGRELLKQNPEHIDVRTLSRFPEFVEFHKSTSSNEPAVSTGDATETPEEALANSHQILRSSLAADLLEAVKKCSPAFFEKLVVDLLVAMGYGGSRQDAGRAIGGSGDDGIDGIIKEDKLGLDVVYLQAKRWAACVGRPVVQAFAGSLEGHRARKGVLITTSHFSQDATEYVQRIEKKIVLIDGKQLATLMIDHAVGVNTVTTYQVKRIDIDYFEED